MIGSPGPTEARAAYRFQSSPHSSNLNVVKALETDEYARVRLLAAPKTVSIGRAQGNLFVGLVSRTGGS